MLTNLSIKNYALIENISVNFTKGLSIITGETGAGKSILLGGLGLVLGKRADLSTLKSKSNKCVIEATFSIDNYQLETFFEENDIDFENETIIRREILPNGKSRAFINDTPATLQTLAILSEKLIDVHSQHQTLKLSNVNFQFQIIDALANNLERIESFKRGLKLFNSLKKELFSFKEEQLKIKEQFDYNLHLFEELESSNLQADEQEKIEQSLEKLNNIEEIKLSLSEMLSISLNEEVGLQNSLNLLVNKISNISKYSKEYQQLFERINSLKIEFDDIASDVESFYENVNFEPSELEKLNDRLQLIYDLQKKHSANSVADLLIIQEELSKKVSVAENFSSIISEKEKEVDTVKIKIDKLAKTIYSERKKTIPKLKTKLENLLLNLGMENTRFKFVLVHSDEYFSNGKDKLELLISANKGVSFGELKKIASGGELSRIMLSVKFILSQFLKLPTIIFDEIDSGVSGEISTKMAEIMQQMSENMQVITITHLPQIASKGQKHYKVSKKDISDNIITHLEEIADNERVNEIAEMLGGKNPSKTAINHAKELLN